MTQSTPAVPPVSAATPERLMQFAWGYAPGLIIGAAVQNGFFDALAKEPMNARELSKATGASERGVTAAMDALVGFALAARDREGRYVLTAESDKFLVSSRPSFLGAFFSHINHDLIPAWLSVAECVRTGAPAKQVNQQQEGAEFFRDFVEALFPVGYPAAIALGQSLDLPKEAPIKVLDIAAGSGVWGIGIAKTYPQAHVTAVDWKDVIPVTQKVAARHGLADRYNYIAGDILQVDLGTGYDVATLGHILHSEGDERSRQLLRKVFGALKPGGTIAIAEFLINDDRTGPPQALTFSVNMLVNTEAGRAFTFAEINRWLQEAGFQAARTLDVPGPGLIVAAKPV